VALEIEAIWAELQAVLGSKTRNVPGVRKLVREISKGTALQCHNIRLRDFRELFLQTPGLTMFDLLDQHADRNLGDHCTACSFYTNGTQAFSVIYCDVCDSSVLDYEPLPIVQAICPQKPGAEPGVGYNALDCMKCLDTYWLTLAADYPSSKYPSLDFGPWTLGQLAEHIEKSYGLALDVDRLQPYDWPDECGQEHDEDWRKRRRGCRVKPQQS
jgi:hypothetical protein